MKTQQSLVPWEQIDSEIENPYDHKDLAGRWIVPPFSVLDSRKSRWQTRKRQWLRLGIQSELGRGGDLAYGIDPNGISTKDGSKAWTDRGKQKVKKIDPSPGGSPRPACDYSRRQRGDGAGRPLARAYAQDLMKGENPKFAKGQPVINSIYGRDKDAGNTESQSGTSIFDPLLCELAYAWFCPPGGRVLDPFAGGSVRGVVGSVTGRQYLGIDLSERQILANRLQAEAICPTRPPIWIVGDASQVKKHAMGRKYDFLFTCPPYGNLEVYSSDPRDLSTMPWDDFLDAYYQIIKDCSDLLHDNRFAAFVVSNVRDKKTGELLDLEGHTIRAFADAGMILWNQLLFINSIGSLPIRVNSQMTKSRKIGRCHQMVLCFLKGDIREAMKSLSNQGLNGWPYRLDS